MKIIEMIDYVDVLKGLCYFLGAFLYFKYFDKPRSYKKNKEKLRNDGFSESMIENINLSDGLRDLKGKLGGCGLIIVGIVYLYLSFKKSN